MRERTAAEIPKPAAARSTRAEPDSLGQELLEAR